MNHNDFSHLNQIVYMDFGSHLYGTMTPTSDFDFKGIHIPTAQEILLQRVQESVSNRQSKQPGEKNLPGQSECESYALSKFLKMAAEGQTVALDMLFAPVEHWGVSSRLWEVIVNNREKLLTSRTAAFLGYCRRQVNKYGIKGSRVKAAEDAMLLFYALCKADHYNDPISEIDHWLRGKGTSEHSSVIEHPIGPTGELGLFYEVCGRKIAYNTRTQEAYKICERIYNEYGHRAHLAKDNSGVDWKAVSHAVRVGYQAIELLTDHHITFPIPQAAQVTRIKLGEVPFDTCAQLIEELMLAVEHAAVGSTLPEEPDHQFIQDLIISSNMLTVLNAGEPDLAHAIYSDDWPTVVQTEYDESY